MKKDKGWALEEILKKMFFDIEGLKLRVENLERPDTNKGFDCPIHGRWGGDDCPECNTKKEPK